VSAPAPPPNAARTRCVSATVRMFSGRIGRRRLSRKGGTLARAPCDRDSPLLRHPRNTNSRPPGKTTCVPRRPTLLVLVQMKGRPLRALRPYV
jgi:hypothetical protein